MNLTELYLSHNHISVMEGLSTLQNLRVLDLSSNKITEISNLEELIRCVNYFGIPLKFNVRWLSVCVFTYKGPIHQLLVIFYSDPLAGLVESVEVVH